MAMKCAEVQGNAVYMEGYALLLHYVIVEHIPHCGTDLISVVSQRMLKWAPVS